MEKKVKLAVIGCGQRGMALLHTLSALPDVEIIAVSDLYQDRMAEASERIYNTKGNRPLQIVDYEEVLKLDDLEVVIVSSSWENHIDVAIGAMKAKKTVGMEVGGVYTVEECWQLIRAYEETKTPFMFLENCCYDKQELMALRMVRDGLFGKVVHCSGAYGHDLREEVTGGAENRHYRLRNYLNRNAENYPTHELGPIAKILDINRGNRMLTLVSVSSKSFGMEAYVEERKETINSNLLGCDFAQGDIVTTIITCAGGETILLKLDTSLPRFYDRELVLRGTKGMYLTSPNIVFLDGVHPEEYWTGIENTEKLFNNATEYEDKYLPDFWKNITPEQRDLGHGGMDYFMMRAFIDAYKKGEEMPIDVYDAASWMVITVLSEESIALGGHPVTIPDFTRGKWLIRERKDVI
ncbi:MAG TPA: Gfo/Idh/MocA family oxidoreductase [Acholeplasmataceae bacterium]|jgi:hypothetical protein|nr:Gfo/Idh/MocA family oxidoreductase [Acholeplasmataceae bacterium]